MSKSVFRAFLCVSAAFGLCGCDTVKAPGVAGGDQIADGSYPRNVALDGLGSGLVAGKTIVTASDGQTPLSVQQAMRNTEDYTVNVQYLFQYFDKDGRLLPGQTAWRFMAMPPRMEVFFESRALDVRAVDWRLTIRSAR